MPQRHSAIVYGEKSEPFKGSIERPSPSSLFCRPERKLLESKDLREAMLLSYLARYFTGEDADRSAVGR